MSFTPVSHEDLISRSRRQSSTPSIARARLRRAVSALPPLERMVIRLRYGLEGREYELAEVAWMLRLPYRTVEKIERQGLRRLRGELSDEAVAA